MKRKLPCETCNPSIEDPCPGADQCRLYLGWEKEAEEDEHFQRIRNKITEIERRVK